MLGDRFTILAVDDDPRILKLMRMVLEKDGYQVVTASSGEQAIQMVADHPPALVLLDIAMPGMDGFVACQRIREFSQVPIIVVTGKGSENDKVRGFEAGADDYVTKPFSPRELSARVRAVIRRSIGASMTAEPAFSVGELVVDFAANKVTLGGREVVLTGTEHRLLVYLARNAGRILTPDQILENVWGEEYLGETRLLRVAIGRLRQKLGDDADEPRYIVTRPGIGYSMPSS